MPTQAQNRATNKYLKNNYDSLVIRYRKDENILPMIEKRIKELNTTKSQYIKSLILKDINN